MQLDRTRLHRKGFSYPTAGNSGSRDFQHKIETRDLEIRHKVFKIVQVSLVNQLYPFWCTVSVFFQKRGRLDRYLWKGDNFENLVSNFRFHYHYALLKIPWMGHKIRIIYFLFMNF